MLKDRWEIREEEAAKAAEESEYKPKENHD